jgi:hypothetical protein
MNLASRQHEMPARRCSTRSKERGRRHFKGMKIAFDTSLRPLRFDYSAQGVSSKIPRRCAS